MHMAKNLSTNREEFFILILIFYAKIIISVNFLGLWTCFRKKRLKLIKFKVKNSSPAKKIFSSSIL